MSKLKYLLPLIIAPVILFIYLYYLEFFNYNNYVFSRFHIDIYRYSFIPGLLVGIWLCVYMFFKKQKIIYIVIGFVFCLITVSSATEALGRSLARTHQMLLGRNFITEKVFTTEYGNDYKFIEFVKNYVLDNKLDRNLVLPPNQPPWRHTGNSEIMNSLLYPIITQSYGFIDGSNYLISSESDGGEYHLWPDFKVPATEIIIYDWQNNKAIEIVNKDWDPSQWQDKKPWGLIIQKIK